jgi:hypothetical protein
MLPSADQNLADWDLNVDFFEISGDFSPEISREFMFWV